MTIFFKNDKMSSQDLIHCMATIALISVSALISEVVFFYTNLGINLADNLLLFNDDDLLPMIKNLLVVSECLFPDFSEKLLSRWSQWVWLLFQPPALEWDHSKGRTISKPVPFHFCTYTLGHVPIYPI